MGDSEGHEQPRTTCTRTLTNARIAQQLNAEAKRKASMEGRGVGGSRPIGGDDDVRDDDGDSGAGASVWSRVHRGKLPLQGFKTRGQLLAARGASALPNPAPSAPAGTLAASGEAHRTPTRGRLSTGLRDHGDGPGASPIPRSSPAAHPGTATGTPARGLEQLSSPALSQLPRFAGLGEDARAPRGMGSGKQGDKAMLRNSRRRLLDPIGAEDEAGPEGTDSAPGTAVHSETLLENESARPRDRSLGGGLAGRRRSLFEDSTPVERQTKGLHARAEGSQSKGLMMAREGPRREDMDPSPGRADDAGGEDQEQEEEGEQERYQEEEQEEEQEEQAHSWALELSPARSAEEESFQGASATPGASVDARAAIAQSLGIPTRNGSPLPARDASEASQQLPPGFQSLETFYAALEVACKLLRTRRQTCTLGHVAPIVAEITHRRFQEAHIAQMLFVAPHILTVEPLLRQMSDTSPVRSNTAASRFGALRWDLSIGLAPPPIGSSLEQDPGAIASGAGREACSNDTRMRSSGQRPGRDGGGGNHGLIRSPSRDEALLQASASDKLSHGQGLGQEGRQGSQHSGASQEVKRRRLFAQGADSSGSAGDVRGVSVVQERWGSQGAGSGTGAARRLSDAEAMVWRKREFRRALQDLHSRMPLLPAVPEAPLPTRRADPDPRGKQAPVGPAKTTRPSPDAHPDGARARAEEALSPVPVRRAPGGGGRRLFSPLEGAEEQVPGTGPEGDQREPGQGSGARGATEMGRAPVPELAVTPPASPKHSQRPPGSITKGPGAAPDLGERCRLSLTPIFQRHPPAAGAPSGTQASASKFRDVAPMDLHPLLRAEGATSQREAVRRATREPGQPAQGDSQEGPSGDPAGPSRPQATIELHPLLRADCQEGGAGDWDREALGSGFQEAERKGELQGSTAAELGPTLDGRLQTPSDATADLGAGTAGAALGVPEEQLDADAAGILGSLPAELLHAVQQREAQKKKDGRAEEVQRRKRARLLGELPLVADVLATVFASSKVAVLAHRDIVASVASSRAKNTNQIEIEQQLSLLVELVPQWLTVKVSSRGETLYRIDKSFPLSTVKTLVAAEKRKLGPW